MAFKIDNVGNLQKQNIVDGNIKIHIGGINTTEGRDKLKTFLRKVYDSDSNGNLDAKEMSRLRDEYGKGITAEKLDTIFKNFFNKEINADSGKLTPIMKKAIEAINKKLYGKTAHYGLFKHKNGKEYAAPQNLSKYVANCQNPAELQKISAYYKMLYSALIKMASRSDTHAQIILNILNEDTLYFGFFSNSKTEKLSEKIQFGGIYMAKYFHKKVICIGKEKFDKNNFVDFEETLIHESVHALDDIKIDDYFEKSVSTASFCIFKDEIWQLADKDIKSVIRIFEKIYALEHETKLRDRKTTAKKYNFYGMGDEYHTIEKESAEIIKNNTWMYDKGEIGETSLSTSFTKFFIRYAQDGFIDDVEKKHLLMEYIATAVEFYLSPDKSKGARLKKFNPELYAFIEKRFLPAILNNRRLK